MFLAGLAILSIAATIHLLTSNTQTYRSPLASPALSDEEMAQVVLKELRR